jgi:ornithine cyclodeaminase/alanine dehydrogenase-like protein (mu-crystallin family)
MKLRILSGADVRRAVTMAEAIQAVREAYVQLSTGQAVVPLRTPVPVAKREGVTLFMPAYLTGSDALGAKIVSVFPANPARGLPLIHAVVLVVDAGTGRPLALMDGTYLTALRTGAASGVATDLLARRDARVAAILGAGAQARTQLEAVCTVRKIEQVWVYDLDRRAAEAYTVARARVVVDSRLASLAEAGDLMIPLRQGLIAETDIHGEIGQVAAGLLPGRSSDQEITFFKSVGVAVQDVAVAHLILRRAAGLGLGSEVML